MKPTETIQLCRLVKACCPSQVFDEFTPLAWAEVLASYSYDDAKQVVLQLVGKPLEPGRSRYIEPGHIIGGIHRMRSQRLTDTPPANPPSDLTAVGYTDWLQRQRAQIAAGEPPAAEPVRTAAPETVRQILSDAGPKQLADGVRDAAAAPHPDLERDTEADLNAERSRQLDALKARIEQGNDTRAAS